MVLFRLDTFFGLVLSELGHFFCFSHIQVLFKSGLCRFENGGLILQCQQCPAVAGRQFAFLNPFGYRLRQCQQPQAVGNGWTGFSDDLGNFFLGHLVFVHQRPVTQRLFHRIQVLPLQIFDQRQFHGFVVA